MKAKPKRMELPKSTRQSFGGNCSECHCGLASNMINFACSLCLNLIIPKFENGRCGKVDQPTQDLQVS